MADMVEFDRPVLKWGNSYGIRLTKSDLKRLGVKPGQKIHGVLQAESISNNLDQIQFLRLGLPTSIDELDRLFVEDTLDETER